MQVEFAALRLDHVLEIRIQYFDPRDICFDARYFVIFFALCRKLSVWYFKQGCDRFLAQPFQFVTRLTSVSYGLVNNLVKAFLNEPQIFDHCKKFVMSHLFHFLICFINSVIIIIITLHYCCTLYSTLMKESVCIYLPTFPF